MTALENDVARQWEIGAVRLTPNQIRIENLFMLQGGNGIELERLQCRGPFWQYVINQHVEVREGEVRDLFLDVSNLPKSSFDEEMLKAEGKPPEWWGARIHQAMQSVLPAGSSARLENVKIRGNALLPGKVEIPLDLFIEVADTRDPDSIRVRTEIPKEDNAEAENAEAENVKAENAEVKTAGEL